MFSTNHFKSRMSQRGLPKKIIDLVLEFGKDNGDKLILNRKETQKLIDEVDDFKKNLLKVMDKGGVTVVLDNEFLVTTYNLDRNKQNDYK